MDLPVLRSGNCEPLKLGVHAGAMALAALCCAYNAAAWLSRREPHLAVNALLYSALAVWEQQHVAHHLAALRKVAALAEAVPAAPDSAEPPAITAVDAAA